MQSATISVVTPNFNQGVYLEDALCSVLSQSHGAVEHIVKDGGSTDDSQAILERYSSRLSSWSSGPDCGQASAINAGFTESTGDIMGWLNADDYYLPGAFAHVAKILDPNEPQLLAGNCIHIGEDSSEAHGSCVPEAAEHQDLRHSDFLIQPSVFWTRAAWDLVGPLREDLHYTMDWDWFLRAGKLISFKYTSRYLSCYRLHPQQKTQTSSPERKRELINIYARHGGQVLASAATAINQHGDRAAKIEAALCRMRLRSVRTWIMRRMFPTIYGELSLQQVARIRRALK